MTKLVLILCIGVFACTSKQPGGSSPGDAAGDPAPGDPQQDANPPIEHQTGTLVETTHGELQGVDEDSLRVFKGIPFAQPPVGNNRLRAPQPLEAWEGVFEAGEFGDSCPAMFALNDMSEDCLTLNVWAHLDDRSRPVMVWIYGGGFLIGETAMGMYEGDDLAEDADVVVVTINYRLGVLGGLALEELRDEDPLGAMGNMGLLDQIAALEWVRANAAAFGGDPGNVTVFGESAGGMSVCALMGSPLADHLFDKAIIQSGACHLVTVAEDGGFGGNAVTLSNQLAADLGCDEFVTDKLACLRDQPTQDFVDVIDAMSMFTDLFGADLGASGPTVDGVVLPTTPYERLASGSAPTRPLIVGSNGNEAAMFTATDFVLTRGEFRDVVSDVFGDPVLAEAVVDLYSVTDFPLAEDAYNAFVGEFLFNCNTYHVVEALGGYAYHLEVGPAILMSTYGPLHAADVPYVFGDFLATGIVPTVVDIATSGNMQQAWGDFARTGMPSWEGGWPATTESNPGVMAIDVLPAFEGEHRGGRCDALQELGILP